MRCVAGEAGQTLRAFGDLRVLELKRVGGMLSVRAQEMLVLMLWNYTVFGKSQIGARRRRSCLSIRRKICKEKIERSSIIWKGEFCEEDFVPRRINLPGATVDRARGLLIYK
jgi:hypothetical protein